MNIKNYIKTNQNKIVKIIIMLLLLLTTSLGIEYIPAAIGCSIFIYEILDNKKIHKIIGIITLLISLVILFIVTKDLGYITIGVLVPLLFVMIIPTKEKRDLLKITIVALIFFDTELLNKSLLFLGKSMWGTNGNYGYASAILSNIYIITSAIFILGFIFKSNKIGYYVTTTFMFILSTANYFVYTITSQAFQLSDIFKAKTAMTVVGQQSLTTFQIIYYVVCAILFIFIYYLIHKLPKEKKQFNIVNIYKTAIIIILCFILIIFNNNTLLNFNGNLMYGTLTNFILTADGSFKKPKNMINVKQELKNNNVNVEKDNKNRPNVIVIMNEAFGDINDGVDSNIYDYSKLMPYYTSLKEKYPSGVAYSSVRGNNTVTSEMEFLTGTSSLFSTEGATIWRQYLSTDSWSIIKDLKEKGYETYGIHPSYSFNYNRLNAWTTLGFDNTTFIEDLKNNKNIIKYRDLVSDKSDYELIIDKYKECKKKNKPFFCYNVTMQNHAGYAESPKTDKKKINTNVKIEKNTKTEVDNYLTLLQLSDDALKELINYFSNVDEDTYILLYGDHQPMFIPQLYSELKNNGIDSTEKSVKASHEIPYIIWSNKNIKKDTPKYTSINYLSTILYNTANLSKPEKLVWNDKLMNDYPIMTANFAIDKNKKYFTNIDIKSKLKNDKELKIEECYTYNLIKK